MKHLFLKQMNEHKELLNKKIPLVDWKNIVVKSLNMYPLHEQPHFSICNELSFHFNGHSKLTGNLCEMKVVEWEYDNNGETKIQFKPTYNRGKYWMYGEESETEEIIHIDDVVEFFKRNEKEFIEENTNQIKN